MYNWFFYYLSAACRRLTRLSCFGHIPPISTSFAYDQLPRKGNKRLVGFFSIHQQPNAHVAFVGQLGRIDILMGRLSSPFIVKIFVWLWLVKAHFTLMNANHRWFTNLKLSTVASLNGWAGFVLAVAKLFSIYISTLAAITDKFRQKLDVNGERWRDQHKWSFRREVIAIRTMYVWIASIQSLNEEREDLAARERTT